MARNEDAMSGEVHASLTLMMRSITNKNASARPWHEFVGYSGSVAVAKDNQKCERDE
jgi:hypothetical protein